MTNSPVKNLVYHAYDMNDKGDLYKNFIKYRPFDQPMPYLGESGEEVAKDKITPRNKNRPIDNPNPLEGEAMT